MVIGGVCGHTGESGVTMLTTGLLVGFGAGSVESDAICTAFESTGGGPALAGTLLDPTGTCTAVTITIIACTAELVGPGAGIVALVSISTVCGHCIAITRAIGGECDLIGICGAEIIITRGRGGSGGATAESDGTCNLQGKWLYAT